MEFIRSVVNFPSRFYACFFRRHNETITFTTHVYNSAFRWHAFTSLKRILFILGIKQVGTTLIFSFERSFFFRRRKSFLFCLFPYDATMVGGTMIGSNSFCLSGSLKRNNAGIYIERLLVRSRPYVSLQRFIPIYFPWSTPFSRSTPLLSVSVFVVLLRTPARKFIRTRRSNLDGIAGTFALLPSNCDSLWLPYDSMTNQFDVLPPKQPTLLRLRYRRRFVR